MLGQNVIIQSIGASSGVIVAGAIFTLPALYILGLEAKFYQIFLSSLFGGLLGIVLLIPFRKYFVKDMQGRYPFPEATATTEVLVSGEKKGNQAKLLAVSGLIGGLYDFIIATFGWWTENISTRIVEWGAVLADKTKLVFKVNTGAAVLGLGYIIGLKYAAIICAGSFTVWFVLIPFICHFADGQTLAVGEGVTTLLRDMSPEDIFLNYARHIGIGGIAMAGVIGIIRSSKIIRQALGLAVSELKGKKKRRRCLYGTYPTGSVDETDPFGADRYSAYHLPVLPVRGVGQLVPFDHRYPDRLYYLVPLYNGCSQRHRHCRYQPGFRYDADDPDPQFTGLGECRLDRYRWNDRSHDYRRCSLYSTFDGGRLHYRPENRFLARNNSSKQEGWKFLVRPSLRQLWPG